MQWKTNDYDDVCGGDGGASPSFPSSPFLNRCCSPARTVPSVPNPRSTPTPYGLACRTTLHSWRKSKRDCRQPSESHRPECHHCLRSNPPTHEHAIESLRRAGSRGSNRLQCSGYTPSERASFYIRGASGAYLGLPSFSNTFSTLTYTSFPSFGGGISRGY